MTKPVRSAVTLLIRVLFLFSGPKRDADLGFWLEHWVNAQFQNSELQDRIQLHAHHFDT